MCDGCSGSGGAPRDHPGLLELAFGLVVFNGPNANLIGKGPSVVVLAAMAMAMAVTVAFAMAPMPAVTLILSGMEVPAFLIRHDDIDRFSGTAGTGQLVWRGPTDPVSNLEVGESDDVRVGKTQLLRMLPPVAPGPSVRRSWVAIDSLEEHGGGNIDPLEDHPPAQTSRAEVDDEIDRSSGTLRQEKDHG